MARQIKTKLPAWSLSSKDLSKWKNLYGVFLFPGHQAQILLRDYGEPIAICFGRPLNLSKDKRVIVGTFLLEEPKENFREFMMGPYCGSFRAFVINMSSKIFDFVNRHEKLFTFLDYSGRQRVKLTLARLEKKSSWLDSKDKPANSCSSQAWQELPSGFGAEEAWAYQEKARLHRLLSAQTSKFAPEVTG